MNEYGLCWFVFAESGRFLTTMENDISTIKVIKTHVRELICSIKPVETTLGQTPWADTHMGPVTRV